MHDMRAPWVLLCTALVCLAAAVRPVPGEVTRPFDPPAQPWLAGHRGVDLVASPGDAVVAALAGRVTFAGPVAGSTWVTLAHGSRWHTTYGVLADLRVTAGEHVGAGDVLGVVAPDADHLDWGARRDGAYIDPLILLGRWRVATVGEQLRWTVAPPAAASGGAALVRRLHGGVLRVP